MIQTPRLVLRPFSPVDEPSVVPMLMCPEFMVWSPSGALTRDAAKRRFEELAAGYQERGFGKLAVMVKASGSLIGYCGIEMCEIGGRQQPELGFRLRKNHRGHGYATEAARAVLDHFFSKFGSGVIAFTEPTNEASKKVLAKLGFTSAGVECYCGMSVVLFRWR